MTTLVTAILFVVFCGCELFAAVRAFGGFFVFVCHSVVWFVVMLSQMLLHVSHCVHLFLLRTILFRLVIVRAVQVSTQSRQCMHVVWWCVQVNLCVVIVVCLLVVLV